MKMKRYKIAFGSFALLPKHWFCAAVFCVQSLPSISFNCRLSCPRVQVVGVLNCCVLQQIVLWNVLTMFWPIFVPSDCCNVSLASIGMAVFTIYIYNNQWVQDWHCTRGHFIHSENCLLQYSLYMV